MITSAIIPAFTIVYQPIWLLGLIITSIASTKLFDPNFKDSIYSPNFRKNTSIYLLVLSILEGITGFGAGPQTSGIISTLTFNLLNRGNSLELHLVLIIPLALFFILHTVSGVGSLILSKGIKNPILFKYIIPIVWIMMYLVVVYLDLYYFL